MGFTQFTDDVDIIQALSDRPNSSDGLTATQLKAKFDRAVAIVWTTYFNSTHLAEIASTTDSSSGADCIGLTTIAGVTGNTVQSALEDIASVVQAVTDGSSGADFVGMTAITETGANATVQSIIEALITRLKATTDSASGADLIGATAQDATITATTVQGQLEQIYTAIGASTGNVNGPASSTDGDFAQFDGVTGKLLKDGLALVTTVGSPGTDTNIASEAAVRAAISAGGSGDFSGPAVAVDANLVLFSGTSGKTGQDGGISLSGSDLTVITGTAGTSTQLSVWNADGDLVDGPVPPSGTIVGHTDTQTLTNKRINPRVGTAASTATLTIDADSYDQYDLTAQAAALTVAAPTGTPVDGQKLIIRIKDNATPRTISWNAIFAVIGTTLPTTTVASKYHYIGCIYNSTSSKWNVLAVAEQA